MNEISVENLARLERRYRTTVFIIAAQIFVALLLTAVAWFIPAAETTLSSQSLTSLWVAILFIALGTFLLRRLFFNWERLKNVALLKGLPAVLGTLQTHAIILGAMAEIVAIMGFIVATFSGDRFDMFRAAAIALIVFLINFPRKSVWKKIVANLEKV